DLRSGGRVQLREGSARASRGGQSRLPVGTVQRCPDPQCRSGGVGMSAPLSPQQLVESALAASSADDCIVIASDTATTTLRWANNTLTTNCVPETVDVTV